MQVVADWEGWRACSGGARSNTPPVDGSARASAVLRGDRDPRRGACGAAAPAPPLVRGVAGMRPERPLRLATGGGASPEGCGPLRPGGVPGGVRDRSWSCCVRSIRAGGPSPAGCGLAPARNRAGVTGGGRLYWQDLSNACWGLSCPRWPMHPWHGQRCTAWGLVRAGLGGRGG